MEIKEMQKYLKDIEDTYRIADFPESVLVEVTAHCNINCIQCANSELTRRKGYMDMQLYRKIVDEVACRAPNAKFWFAFYGEPLLLRYKLYYMIKYAKNKGLTNTYLNTNGMLLNEEMADMLIDSGIDHIVIGVDGYSAEVFEEIRRGAKRDTVYNNILSMHKKMLAQDTVAPRMEVQFILMDENEYELEEYVQFWKRQGIAVKIRNRVTWSGHVETGSNIDSSIERVACGWTIGICPITWEGEIVACGTDCDAQYTFGNVNTATIKEIWNKQKRIFAEKHMNHQFECLPEFCRNCMDWQVIGTVDFDEAGNRHFKYNYILPGGGGGGVINGHLFSALTKKKKKKKIFKYD
jgi:radical SAM protein with 4Fe4S-binding SPASM domain